MYNDNKNDNNLEEMYGGELKELTDFSWLTSSTSKISKSPPLWFLDIINKRGIGMLYLLFYANYPWVVFPEFIPNFSIVSFHKKENKRKPIKPQKLQLRYYQGIEALDIDMQIQKLVSKCCNTKIQKTKGMLKLEDDNFITFLFPSNVLFNVLEALGMPKEEIYKKEYVKEGDIDWSLIGL